MPDNPKPKPMIGENGEPLCANTCPAYNRHSAYRCKIDPKAGIFPMLCRLAVLAMAEKINIMDGLIDKMLDWEGLPGEVIALTAERWKREQKEDADDG